MTQSTAGPRASGSLIPDLSVVIPALNEAANLKLLLPLIQQVVTELSISAEIVVVDGGSVDETSSIVAQLNARLIQQTERGYGGALLAGLAAARASYVATMDADLSHPPIFLKDFWRERVNSDVLIASRYIAGGRADMSLSRRILSTILNRTYAILLGLKLRDLSSGFRMYQRKQIEKLELRGRDFDVLEEILVKIHVNGGRIREVPFHYQVRQSGESHARLLKFGWAYTKTLWRMCRLRYSK
ncbi:MAG TPA: glycosyltransferase [Pyrinomonadaceae bacterium]|nr:glycosyltransferase [Pyrinomonadaceae bacterium]